MYSVNRSVAIIRPRQPFVDWANSLPDASAPVRLDSFKEDNLAILIPEYETPKEAEFYVSELWKDLFEQKLWNWCTNESWWPTERTLKKFWKWFDAEYHSVVLDPYEDPIAKEECEE
ncbi:MAG: hypothetical protein V1800_13460 [Candidatus Latescibacterota bacterium]